MERIRAATLAMLLTLPLIAAAIMLDGQAPAPREDSTTPSMTPPTYAPVKRVFISGHSLTDQPFPDYLARLSAGARIPIAWNRQYLPGSSIKMRTRGAGIDGWNGYAAGVDRHGQPIDTLREIWRPSVPGGAYDTLIVTEQHSLLETIVWSDTIRYLRDMHERIVGLDAGAQTFLYESWLTVSDRADPQRWIAYERAAEPVWACVAERINVSLAAEGRSDRIRPLPVALALATLVEAATQNDPVPGISMDTISATMARLFRDDVHLTDAGAFYVALASFALIHGTPAPGMWAPLGMASRTAEALRRHAWHFATRHQAAAPMALSRCRDYVSTTFVPIYLAYQRDTNWRTGGTAHAWASWARYSVAWPRLFRREDATNPFYFDPQTDQNYWFHRQR